MTKVRAGSNGKSPLQGRHQCRGHEAGKSARVRAEMSTKNKLISGGRLVRGQAAPRGCPEVQSWVNWREKKSPASEALFSPQLRADQIQGCRETVFFWPVCQSVTAPLTMETHLALISCLLFPGAGIINTRL